MLRHRVSLLPFDAGEQLWDAAEDLVLNGFSQQQFCVLGNLSPDRVGTPQLLSEASIVQLRLSGDSTIEARCGSEAAVLFETPSPLHSAIEKTRQGLIASIETAVAHKRLILLVAARSAPQHTLGARLLLRHGRHALQTHEFSAVPKASQSGLTSLTSGPRQEVRHVR